MPSTHTTHHTCACAHTTSPPIVALPLLSSPPTLPIHACRLAWCRYWHWIFSEGFGVAVNVWSAKPHRRFTGPKKFPGGAADWPAIKAWTPERVVEMWTGGHNSGSGFQYDIDKKITCNDQF